MFSKANKAKGRTEPSTTPNGAPPVLGGADAAVPKDLGDKALKTSSADSLGSSASPVETKPVATPLSAKILAAMTASVKGIKPSNESGRVLGIMGAHSRSIEELLSDTTIYPCIMENFEIEKTSSNEVEDYFRRILESLELAPAIESKILKQFLSKSTVFKKADYMRKFISQLEIVIQAENKPLAQKIHSAQEYGIAGACMNVVSGKVSPKTQQSYNPRFKALSPVASLAKVNDILEVNSLNFVDRFYLLQDIASVMRFIDDARLEQLKGPMQSILLKNLNSLNAEISTMQDRVLLGEIYSDLSGFMQGIPKKLHEWQSKSANSPSDQELQQAIEEALSKLTIKILEKTGQNLEANQSRAQELSDPTTTQAFASRLSGIDSDLGDLHRDASNVQKRQKSSAVKSAPAPAKATGFLNAFSSQHATNTSSTEYIGKPVTGIQQYQQLTQQLSDSFKTLKKQTKEKIKSFQGTEQDGIRPLIIQHTDKPEQKITHSLDGNKNLAINLHPADPADWSIIHVMREAVTCDLHLTLKPSPNRDLDTLLKVYHASLIHSEGHVKLNAADLEKLDGLLQVQNRTEKDQTRADTYLALKACAQGALSVDALKTRSLGQPLGQLQDAPSQQKKRRLF